MSRIHIERPIHKSSVKPLSNFLRKLHLEFGQILPREPLTLHTTLATGADSAVDLAELAAITKDRPSSAGETCHTSVRGVVYVGRTAVLNSVALMLHDTTGMLSDESAYYNEKFGQYDQTAPYLPHITLGKAFVNHANGAALIKNVREWSESHAPDEIMLAPVRTHIRLDRDPTRISSQSSEPIITKTAS